ncbi:zinc-binding dehydrogenase [Streptomyces sp. NPDC059994]|uniref:zinc-binding dehydrogenase n=1 Tax=Streptomyces sp. NPDC059994 TaxID=3347029 RepID=UPI0036B2F988
MPIAMTRTGAKRDALLKAGAAEVLATDEEDVVERVLGLTAGRGAEFVFDAVAGPGVLDLARAVAPGGTLIEYGALSGVTSGLRTGAFAPAVDRVFGLDEIVEAHRYMEAGGRVGKIVVTVDH